MWTPPGRLGTAPNLSLAYDSSNGPGLLGLGWSMGGFSSIHRCPETETGLWCLDGEPFDVARANLGVRIGLLCANAGQCASFAPDEIDELMKGVAQPSEPGEIYVVEEPDGGKRVYEDVFGIDNYQLVRDWDRNGNAIVYEWEEGWKPDGNLGFLSEDRRSMPRPRAVHYTATADSEGVYSVLFKYGSGTTGGGDKRIDPFLGMAGDEPLDLWQLLERVEVYGPNSTSAVRTHQLRYHASQGGLSLLESVELCDAAGVCLPPTTFDYSHGGAGFRQAQNTGFTLPDERIQFPLKEDFEFDVLNNPPTGGYDPSLLKGNYFVLDLDGDGRDDILALKNGQWHPLYARPEPDGFGVWFDWQPPIPALFLGALERTAIINNGYDAGMSLVAQHGGGVERVGVPSAPLGLRTHDLQLGDPEQLFTLDMDGDGLVDVLTCNLAGQDRWVLQKNRADWDTLGGVYALDIGDDAGSNVDELKCGVAEFSVRTDDVGRASLAARWNELDSTDGFRLRLHLGELEEQLGASGMGSSTDSLGRIYLDVNRDGLPDALRRASGPEDTTKFHLRGSGTSEDADLPTRAPENIYNRFFADDEVMSAPAEWGAAIVVDWFGDGGSQILVPQDMGHQEDVFITHNEITTETALVRLDLWIEDRIEDTFDLDDDWIVTNLPGADRFEDTLAIDPHHHFTSGEVGRMVGDFNGDTLDDFLALEVGVEELVLHLHEKAVDAPRPNLLVGVTDGLGLETEIEYGSTADTKVYLSDTYCSELASDPSYMGMCPPKNQIVVKSHSIDHGGTMELNFDGRVDYRYDQARYDRERQRFLGFGRVFRDYWVSDDFEMTLRSSSLTIQDNLTDEELGMPFPYVGRPEEVVTVTRDEDGDVEVARTRTTYERFDVAGVPTVVPRLVRFDRYGWRDDGQTQIEYPIDGSLPLDALLPYTWSDDVRSENRSTKNWSLG